MNKIWVVILWMVLLLCGVAQGQSSTALAEQVEAATPAQKSVLDGASPSDLKLEEAPWREGEVLEYTTRQKKSECDGYKHWSSLRLFSTVSGHWTFEQQSVSGFERLEFDPETMAPINSSLSGGLESFHIHYQGHIAEIVNDQGRALRRRALDGPVFDEREVPLILRRLPWAEGHNVRLALLSRGTGSEDTVGSVNEYEFAILGEQDMRTPAGKFHCYVIDEKLANEGTASTRFWISTGASHFMIKEEQRNVVTELAATGVTTEDTVYTDEETGASFKVPAGWGVQPFASKKDDSGKLTTWMDLMDLHSPAFVGVSLESCGECSPKTSADIRAEAEEKAKRPYSDKIRPASMQDRQIGGRDALSWIADDARTHAIHYTMRTRGAAWDAEFSATVEPENFDALRPTLDAIFDSITTK
jgi:hypothetical protein